MAALFWNSDRRDLTESTGSIGALRIVIENAIKGIGFAEVRRSDLDVSGGKNGVFVSIAHFPIGGRSFFEVVMASGDAEAVTRSTRDEVVTKLRNLTFFD